MGKKPGYFDEAEDLYVVDGLTLEGIAARLPVSVTTLSRWKGEGEWEERRAELARALVQIKRDRLKARQELVKALLNTRNKSDLSAQDIYAATAIERCLGQGEKKAGEDGAAPEIDRPALFLEDLQFVAKVLKETDPEGLKVVARNFETIVARFKASLTAGGDARPTKA